MYFKSNKFKKKKFLHNGPIQNNIKIQKYYQLNVLQASKVLFYVEWKNIFAVICHYYVYDIILFLTPTF